MTAFFRAVRNRDRYGAESLLLAAIFSALGVKHEWRLPR
jgi:hypothetical protein